MLRVEKYRVLFIAGSLALMLIATIPALTLFIQVPSGSQSFSELWLLDSRHRTEAYPFNVTVNEVYSTYIGVRNHLGHTAYYRVLVKFRNQTQPHPITSSATPSPLPSVHEFNFIVQDGEMWEESVRLRLLNIERTGDVLLIKDLSINEIIFRVNSLSVRDAEKHGFFYQFFFELWFYNSTFQGFQYHNRYVQLGLNVTI